MKRRTFVKKSVAASILTPLALTGLINAAGATETGGGGTTETGGTEYTTVPETTWFTTEATTTMGFSYGPCVSFQEYGQRILYKRVFYEYDPEIGGVVGAWYCFRVYHCKNSIGQIIGQFRGPYSPCAGGDGCIDAEYCDTSHIFYNLATCSILQP